MDLSKFNLDKPEDPVARGLIAMDTVDFVGDILAFDQSIAASGWAHLHGQGGVLTIREVGMLPTEVSHKGHEGTLQRGATLHRLATPLILRIRPHCIAHELPPVGGRMMRPESSLVAATAIRIAAAEYGVSVKMYGAQPVKKLLTGNGNADKKEVRAALDRLFPILVEMKPRNDNTYDAVGLAYKAAKEWRDG